MQNFLMVIVTAECFVLCYYSLNREMVKWDCGVQSCLVWYWQSSSLSNDYDTNILRETIRRASYLQAHFQNPLMAAKKNIYITILNYTTDCHSRLSISRRNLLSAWYDHITVYDCEECKIRESRQCCVTTITVCAFSSRWIFHLQKILNRNENLYIED